MQKSLFLLVGIVLLIINIFFIGLVRYDENSTELFIKHKPSLIFNFSKENEQLYKEFVSDHHIDDRGRSFLPLILIQLMLSGFVVSIIKTDLKRKAALYIFHFTICIVGFFQIIVMAFNQTNKMITTIILIGVVVLEFVLIKLFLAEKKDTTLA